MPTADATTIDDRVLAPAPGVQPASPLYADLAADYELLGELGRGGTAIVYRARDRRLGREVALKVVRVAPALLAATGGGGTGVSGSGSGEWGRSEAVARLAREARVIAQLEHPHIVRVHAVRELADGLALEMPYVRGRTLKQLVAAEGPLAPARAARLLADVAHALAHAHAHGVVHRDVKPENVFVEPADAATGRPERALLADFGVARATEADAPEARLTQTGVTLGTPAYMAPEQIEGRAALDGRADVYSLGLLGWELLTGERPWAGAGLFAVLQRQQQDALPPIEAVRPAGLPPVPPALQYVLERCMQKAPAARWASAAAAAAQLEQPEPQPDFAQWRRHHADRVREAQRAPREAPTVSAGAATLLRTALDTVRFRRVREDAPSERLAIRTSAGGPPVDDPTPAWGRARPRRLPVPGRLALLGGTLLVGLGTTLAVRGESAALGTSAPGRGRIADSARGDVARAARRGASTASGRPASARAATAGATTGAPPLARVTPVPAVGSRPIAAPTDSGSAATTPGLLARWSARLRGAPSTTAPSTAAPSSTAPIDSEPARAPHPRALVGAWTHGDARSQYGDSLLLELHADGSVRSSTRRYVMTPATGWHVVHDVQPGRWELRYGPFGGTSLCVTLRAKPNEASCASAIVGHNASGPVLTYGGRHWRPPVPTIDRRAAKGRGRD